MPQAAASSALNASNPRPAASDAWYRRVAKRSRMAGTASSSRRVFAKVARRQPTETAMIEASCHCGAVRLRIAAAPQSVTDCNCSICRRLGALWAYYPPAEVEIVSPPEATETYAWGDKDLAFHRCRVCGCATHWQGLKPHAPERMGVNGRMMDPGVLTSAKVRRFDGADTWTLLDEA